MAKRKERFAMLPEFVIEARNAPHPQREAAPIFSPSKVESLCLLYNSRAAKGVRKIMINKFDTANRLRWKDKTFSPYK
jgi:hypothetical protein